MEAPEQQRWFLRKHEDGSVFGPLTFDQLKRWAFTAQVAPQDLISADEHTWIKAPMLPQLEMDWLVELTSERYYGPTTLGALQEFLRNGEITEETGIINCCDGTRWQLNELPQLAAIARLEQEAFETSVAAVLEEGPSATRIAIDLRERIRDLEQSLREERRALQEADERYRELEQKYRKLTESQAAREATL